VSYAILILPSIHQKYVHNNNQQINLHSESPGHSRLLSRKHLHKPFHNCFYAPKAFLAYPGAEEFLAYHQAIPESERSDFYVLGDNGYFYILAQQTPPYFFTFYNGCSIFDQKRIIAWLERKNIRRIIYNSTVHSFDNVPNLARVPILFEHVVKNYAPARQFASFCVLEKKALPPAETLAFWLSRLGHELDLGHIPSNTSFALMSDCTGLKPPACFDLLEIKTPPASQARKRSIYLRYGMYSLAISFQQNDRDTHYLVPLDRIWFWSVLKEAGLKHFLTIDYESDMHARLIQKKAPVDILY